MKIRTLILSAAAAAVTLFTLPGQAGLQTQTDTNSLASSTTNVFRLYSDPSGTYTNGEAPGGVSVFDCSKAQSAYVEVGGFFTNSASGASNVVYVIAQSVDLAGWTNGAQTVTLTIPATTTNWVNAQVAISAAYPGYGWREFRNTNAANVICVTGTGYVKFFTKTGD